MYGRLFCCIVCLLSVCNVMSIGRWSEFSAWIVVQVCSVCFKNVIGQGTRFLCTRCSHWVHSRAPSPPPSPAPTPTMSDKTFNILQWNANGIGNKQTELGIFLEAHNGKVEKSQHPELHHSTTGSLPMPRRRLTVF